MKTSLLLGGAIVLCLCAFFAPSLFAGLVGPKLEGAWQPDDYGTRVEIKGDTMLVLWRNVPVLETKFSVSHEGKKYVLQLEKTEMKDPKRSGTGARITECWVEDGKMHLRQHFEISGDDEEILEKTEESRYGAVKVVSDEMLPRLRGQWRCDADGGWELKISGETLQCRWRGGEWEQPVPIAVVRDIENPKRIRVVHKDPAEEELPPFRPFRYVDGKLVTRVIVTDKTPPELVFEKAE